MSSILNYIGSFMLLLAIITIFPISFPIIWLTTYILYRRERKNSNEPKLRFRKNRPFFFFGTTISTETLIFDAAGGLANDTINLIPSISAKIPNTIFRKVFITDIKRKPEYSKSFVCVQTETSFGTIVSVIFYIIPVGPDLYVQWWSLVQGKVGFWEKFWFIVGSPFTFPFWIAAHGRKEFSIIAQLAGRIEFTYDIFDITSWIITYQHRFFGDLVIWMENKGIDVSNYKNNPPSLNVLNIGGSGNIIGAVAQGSSSRATTKTSQISSTQQ